MRIIADENLHSFLVGHLRENGYDVFPISEKLAGIPDEEVVKIVQKQEGILVTEDKDFGELVFAYRIAKVTIIFLRYRKQEVEKIAENLIKIVEEYSQKKGEYFITITSTRIRITQI